MLCKEKGLEILTLLTHPLPEGSHLVMIRVRGDKVEELINTLWQNHYEVMATAPPH